MHIGIVHYAAPPVVGGVELTIYHHARVLTGLGHDVTVVAGQGAPVQPGVTFQAEPLVGSRSEQISAANKSLAGGAIPDNFDALVDQTRAALLSHLGDCDVVIGHNFFTLHKNLVLTAAVCRLTETNEGPPWVAWHHDFAWLRPQYQSDLHRREPWELLRRPWPGIRHVTVSQAQQVDLARLYGLPREEIAVISPGVDPQRFYRCPESVADLIDRWGLMEADCVFLLPARITRRKNIELGLKWLAAVRRQADWDARLVVTGPPGPHNPTNLAYLDNLLSMRRELDIEQAAHFVYQANGSDDPLLLNDEELATFYQVADGMFFPSRQEGFGIPILEAGLARVPVFCADLSPFHESAGTHATFFSPDTPSTQVAQTVIKTLQQDRAFRLRRRVLANFTWQGITNEKIVPLLQTVVD